MTLANPTSGLSIPGRNQQAPGMWPTLPASAFDPATGQLTPAAMAQFGINPAYSGADIWAGNTPSGLSASNKFGYIPGTNDPNGGFGLQMLNPSGATTSTQY